ncbi:hypothetical protein ES708_22300 [subsurface metagenome]
MLDAPVKHLGALVLFVAPMVGSPRLLGFIHKVDEIAAVGLFVGEDTLKQSFYLGVVDGLDVLFIELYGVIFLQYVVCHPFGHQLATGAHLSSRQAGDATQFNNGLG